MRDPVNAVVGSPWQWDDLHQSGDPHAFQRRAHLLPESYDCLWVAGQHNSLVASSCQLPARSKRVSDT